jgi:aldose 1-epimerase
MGARSLRVAAGPDTIELRAGAARVLVAPVVGGAIAAFDWNGEAILRPTRAKALANGDVREFACYPLVPYSNRIAGATLHCHGQTFALLRYLPADPHAIHGNGWQRRWDVVEVGSSHALLELVHEPAGEHVHEWPFPFRVTQAFALADTALTLRLDIFNTGDRTFPFGLGWHPFFARSAATELEIHTGGVWLTDATHLPTQHVAVPAQWDFTASRAIGTTTVDNCFTGWQPPAVVRWPACGLAVEMSADAANDHIVVFIPQDSDYIALEPVTHMTDAFNRAAIGRQDTGTRLLAPQAGFSCTMRFSIVPIR